MVNGNILYQVLDGLACFVVVLILVFLSCGCYPAKIYVKTDGVQNNGIKIIPCKATNKKNCGPAGHDKIFSNGKRAKHFHEGSYGILGAGVRGECLSLRKFQSHAMRQPTLLIRC